MRYRRKRFIFLIFRQIIWLPKIGRSEWILQPPEVVAKKRVCSKHFSKEMISGTKLKKTAFPDIFEEGIGEKGVNVGASTSSMNVTPVSSSPMVIVNKTEVIEEHCEDHVNPSTCATPEKKSEGTRTSPRLSSTTSRKRKLQRTMRDLKRKSASSTDNTSRNIRDKDFIKFCRENLKPLMADFLIAELK